MAGEDKRTEQRTGRITLERLNTMPLDGAQDHCSGFFEHSPWITDGALERRPFRTLRDLHSACVELLRSAGRDAQLGLILAHPDLVGRLAREGRLTRESTSEQAAAGLNELSEPEIEAFERYNAAYRKRFGFPFVICARKNRKEAILKALPKRLANDRESEIETALGQIAEIAWLRMCDVVEVTLQR